MDQVTQKKSLYHWIWLFLNM